jgi:hypothetical protein
MARNPMPAFADRRRAGALHGQVFDPLGKEPMNKVPSYVEWINNFTGPQRQNQALPYHLERFRPDRLKSTTIEKHVGEDEKKPKNLKANV